MPEDGEFQNAAQEAWERVYPGGMVVGYFVVLEGIDADGERHLDWSWSPGLKTWQLKGYVTEARDSQFSGQLADDLTSES